MFDELSSASEAEEDCLYRNANMINWIQSRRCIVSKEISELPPWIGVPKKLPVIEERSEFGVQCGLEKWSDVEKQVATDVIQICDVEIQFEQKLELSQEICYEFSAEDRMLEELSGLVFKEKLLAWFSDQKPSQELQFSIKPETPQAKILNCHIDVKSWTYVVLVKDENEEVYIEFWRLKNLFRPKIVKLTFDRSGQTCHFSYARDRISVASSNEVFIADAKMGNLTNHIMFKETLISATFLTNDSFFIETSIGSILKCQIDQNFKIEKIFTIPSLSGPFFQIQVSNSYWTVSTKNKIVFYYPDKETFKEICCSIVNDKLELDEDHNKLLVFDCSHNKAVIYSIDEHNFGEVLYEFSFELSENIQDFKFYQESLFTLTNDGLISKWCLLKHGRKKRAGFCKTELFGCLLFYVLEQKFIIVTSQKIVHCVINS